jgi:hypothetical protein
VEVPTPGDDPSIEADWFEAPRHAVSPIVKKLHARERAGLDCD